MTRRWKEDMSVVQLTRLFLIDEVRLDLLLVRSCRLLADIIMSLGEVFERIFSDSGLIWTVDACRVRKD